MNCFCRILFAVLFLIGWPVLAADADWSIDVGPPQHVLGLVEWATYHMSWFPDGTMGVIKNGNGYQFFGAGRSARDAGFQQGTYRFGGSLEHIAPDNVSADGFPQPSLQPGKIQPDPQGSDFDRDYAGGGPTMRVRHGNATVLLQMYHGEYHYNYNPSNRPFYASLGMAISEDEGKTFHKIGEIIEAAITRQQNIDLRSNAPLINRAIDLGGGAFIEADADGQPLARPNADSKDTYLYVIFCDMDITLKRPRDQSIGVAIARAKKSEVVAAALAHRVVAWKKYFLPPGVKEERGTDYFTEPGIGGHMTPIIARSHDELSITFPTIAYDMAAAEFIMVYTNSIPRQQIRLRHSGDLMHWSDATTLVAVDTPGSVGYPTIIGTGADPCLLGREFFLYYKSSAKSFIDWATAQLVRRKITIR